MSLCTHHPAQKASLTIETAMVLPLFLFFLINLISIVSILSTYSRLQTVVHQVGMKMASYAYVKEKATDQLPSNLLSVLYVKLEIEKNIGISYLENTQIKNKKDGLSYFQSQILDTKEDLVDVVVSYTMQPFVNFLGYGEFNLINRCRVRGFTGYDNALYGGFADDEAVVYITNTGTVYHKERTCSHLQLSIKKVVKEALDEIRNNSGGKYYLCELCGKKGEKPMTFFVTEYGDRYHTSLTCSGLKRTITEILISQVDGRGPCSKCGG